MLEGALGSLLAAFPNQMGPAVRQLEILILSLNELIGVSQIKIIVSINFLALTFIV